MERFGLHSQKRGGSETLPCERTDAINLVSWRSQDETTEISNIFNPLPRSKHTWICYTVKPRARSQVGFKENKKKLKKSLGELWEIDWEHQTPRYQKPHKLKGICLGHISAWLLVMDVNQDPPRAIKQLNSQMPRSRCGAAKDTGSAAKRRDGECSPSLQPHQQNGEVRDVSGVACGLKQK